VRLLSKCALFALLIPCAVLGQTLGSVNGQCAKGGQALVTQGLPSTGTQNLSASEGTVALSLGTGAIGSFPGCTITVYLTGTTNIATIYSTITSTPLANPFTGNADGSFLFFALPVGYDILISGGGMPSPVTLTDVVPVAFAWSRLSGDLTETQLIAFDGPVLGTPDTGISRLTSPALIGIGNGTAGDFSGAIKLQEVIYANNLGGGFILVAPNTGASFSDWSLPTTVIPNLHMVGCSVGAGVCTLADTNVSYTGGGIQFSPRAFATLSACSSGNEGELESVNNSTTNTWGATITGGGSDHVVAYCDGSNWTVAAK
jgi:hypothetical protein